ncbi:short chain dehydrogenase [Croceivirga radicis]|uniref:Short chain dehydrogenase n=1 Tax=Croceivirga radicis TaxID=1929488 RepID=A0A1V6LSN8_9FLAO|nr:SDR family oxidoreductase [Croceivirga radicis]OQD42996.1 short chain dehydrogenase [Croceivirga radicis]
MNEKKVVWITGASSGIGEALVYEYASLHYNIILSARNTEKLTAIANSIKDRTGTAILPLDLNELDAMETKAEKAFNCFGRIDILINNAGISQRSLITETSLAVYEKLMRVNYLGTVALTKALLPYYINQKHGTIGVVTSLMGKFASPYRSGYCGAKHALHGFFDALRLEHQKDGISVTLICPGFVATSIAKNALIGSGQKQGTDDKATSEGLAPELAARKIRVGLQKKKFEIYIGGKELLGIYLKRFFPKLLHRLVLKSTVR